MTASLCSSLLFLVLFFITSVAPVPMSVHVHGCWKSLQSLKYMSSPPLPPPPPPPYLLCMPFLFCFWGVGGCLNYMGLCTIFLFDACEEENGYCVSVIVYLWVQFCLTVVCEVVFLAHIKMMQVCFSVNCTFETLHGHLLLALYNSVILFFVSQLCWEVFGSL